MGRATEDQPDNRVLRTDPARSRHCGLHSIRFCVAASREAMPLCSHRVLGIDAFDVRCARLIISSPAFPPEPPIGPPVRWIQSPPLRFEKGM
jgi:hypothetical protein